MKLFIIICSFSFYLFRLFFKFCVQKNRNHQTTLFAYFFKKRRVLMNIARQSIKPLFLSPSTKTSSSVSEQKTSWQKVFVFSMLSNPCSSLLLAPFIVCECSSFSTDAETWQSISSKVTKSLQLGQVALCDLYERML